MALGAGFLTPRLITYYKSLGVTANSINGRLLNAMITQYTLKTDGTTATTPPLAKYCNDRP